MGLRRVAVFVSLAVAGCTRPNPAFDDTEPGTAGAGGDGPKVTVSGSEGGSTDGPVDGTSLVTSSTADATVDGTADGGSTTVPPSDTGSAEEGVVLYQGPIISGAIPSIAGQEELDPARMACVAAAQEFPGACPDPEATASILRFSDPLLDELIARGVPTTLPILSPTGGFIADDLETLIASGPELPLTETPSVFSGNSAMFWTGGRQPTDSNCQGWTVGPVKGQIVLGTLGSPDVASASWLAVDQQSCASSFSILCSCW